MQNPPTDELVHQLASRRSLLALLAAVALAAVAGWLMVGGGLEVLRARIGQSAGPGDVGGPAPAFHLASAGGGAVQLSELRGQVVLLNFWATWCTPCRTEMPEIESVYRAQRGRGFEVLAINVQESEAQVQPFMAELGLTFQALLDRDGTVTRTYLARGLPTSVLVDRQGIVRYVRTGTLTEQMLREQLSRLGL